MKHPIEFSSPIQYLKKNKFCYKKSNFKFNELFFVSFVSLDLDAWINEPQESSESDSDSEIMENLFVKAEKAGRTERYQPELTEEELQKVSLLTSKKNVTSQ